MNEETKQNIIITTLWAISILLFIVPAYLWVITADTRVILEDRTGLLFSKITLIPSLLVMCVIYIKTKNIALARYFAFYSRMMIDAGIFIAMFSFRVRSTIEMYVTPTIAIHISMVIGCLLLILTIYAFYSIFEGKLKPYFSKKTS